MSRFGGIVEFYIEIIVWVAIWGIVTHLVTQYSNDTYQVALAYIVIAIVGTIILFYIFDYGNKKESEVDVL